VVIYSHTRCRIQLRWQNSSPRKVIAIQLLISAGRNTSDLSLMTISRSESKNSNTRLRFFFDENTSRSFDLRLMCGCSECLTCSHLDDVLMVKFSKIFDFADGGHIEPVLKLANFYFLNGNFTSSGNFSSFKGLRRHRRYEGKTSHTTINYSISTLPNF
jgi:hypothetical protein